MRKGIIIIIVIVFIFLLLIGTFIIMNKKQMQAINEFEFVEIDMATVADGTYIGEADSGMVFVKVEVMVADHKITNINIIEHTKGLGGKAEKIINDMIEVNSYEVDAVSGATVSSQTIKFAVCNALANGIK